MVSSHVEATFIIVSNRTFYKGRDRIIVTPHTCESHPMFSFPSWRPAARRAWPAAACYNYLQVRVRVFLRACACRSVVV
jgi:hypothetical protein